MTDEDLTLFLRNAREAPSFRRLEWRSAIEGAGAEAIAPMLDWLAEAALASFAGLVLEGLARRGNADVILDELRNLYPTFRGDREYLTRLGQRIAKLKDAPPPLPVRVKVWVGKINQARRALSEPYLSPDQIDQLLQTWSNLQARPDRYMNQCWLCTAPVEEGLHERCTSCHWLRCYCGACIAPTHGYCRIGAARYPEIVWRQSS